MRLVSTVLAASVLALSATFVGTTFAEDCDAPSPVVCQPSSSHGLFTLCHMLFCETNCFGPDPCCSCCDDYCRRPLPPVPPTPCQSCCDDYCRNPLPCPPCQPCDWCCDDYCAKPLPCVRAACLPWFRCYSDECCDK